MKLTDVGPVGEVKRKRERERDRGRKNIWGT